MTKVIDSKNYSNEFELGKHRIALASYSFHGLHGAGKCDVFTYLEMLRSRYHVQWADIWTGYIPEPDKDFAAKIRKVMDNYGIRLANLCIDGPHLWMDKPEERAAHKKTMLGYIETGKILGAKTIRIDFGGKEGHTMPDEAFDYIVETYKEYCDICADSGIKIGPENHWGWDRVPEYLEKVYKAVDHPAYGHLFHFTNFFDEPERGLETVLKYAMHTHVSASSLPVAKETIRKLHNAGYKGAYSVEHHSGKFERERVEWQLGAVRSFISELMEEGTDKTVAEDYTTSIYK
jgi:sugar phosphate isomerase/epimerase